LEGGRRVVEYATFSKSRVQNRVACGIQSVSGCLTPETRRGHEGPGQGRTSRVQAGWRPYILGVYAIVAKQRMDSLTQLGSKRPWAYKAKAHIGRELVREHYRSRCLRCREPSLVVYRLRRQIHNVEASSEPGLCQEPALVHSSMCKHGFRYAQYVPFARRILHFDSCLLGSIRRENRGA